MVKHLETGLRGEEAAVEYLEANGFQILHRRLRIGRSDIDIVARKPKDGTLRFVEVKTRTASGEVSLHSDTSPEAAISPAKARQLIRSAEMYMRSNRKSCEMTIDLIAVSLHANGSVTKINYYTDILR